MTLGQTNPRSDSRARRDAGYALVAAVTAVAAFAYLAFQVLAANQGGIAIMSGRMRQAKLAAAAEAGIAQAVHGLAATDRGVRWSIDGRPRRLDFDGVDLTVTVEDERGKAPLAGLNDGQVHALFAGAGARPDQLEALVAAYREWQADDVVETEPDTGPFRAKPAPPVRHGFFRTLGELAALKDMDPAVWASIAPSATVFFEESGPFEPSHATPLARAAMSGRDPGSSEEQANEAEIDAQRPEEQIALDEHYIGRTLTVSVVARDHDGARTHRMAIIELTGDKAAPYWVRYVE